MLRFALALLRFVESFNIDRFGAFVPPVDCVSDRFCRLLMPCVTALLVQMRVPPSMMTAEGGRGSLAATICSPSV